MILRWSTWTSMQDRIPSLLFWLTISLGSNQSLRRLGRGHTGKCPLPSDRPPFGVSWKSRSLCGCLNNPWPCFGSTFMRHSPTLLWIPTRPISLFGFLYSVNRIGSAVRHHMVFCIQLFILCYNPSVHGLYGHETMPSSLNR